MRKAAGGILLLKPGLGTITIGYGARIVRRSATAGLLRRWTVEA